MENIIRKILNGKKKKILLIVIIVVLIMVVAKPGNDLEEGISQEKRGNVPSTLATAIAEAVLYSEEGSEGKSEEQQIRIVQNWLGEYTYDINLDNITNEVIKNCNSVNSYFISKNKKEYLKKMIKAEFVTQYPNLGGIAPASSFQGAINFIRYKADGTTKNLEYIPLGNESDTGSNTLYGLVNGQNSESLNKFSLDTEGNLIVAIYTETITKEKNGEYDTDYVESSESVDYSSTDNGYLNSAPEQKTYEYQTRKFQYKSLVANCTMPFEYLWAFLVCSEDEQFVSDLADLVLGSTIDIGVYESLNTNEELTIQSHNINEKNSERIDKRQAKQPPEGDVEYTEVKYGTWDVSITAKHKYEGKYIKTNSYDITNLAMNKADIWYMCQTVEYVKEETPATGLHLETTRNSELDGDFVLNDRAIGNWYRDRSNPIENVEGYTITPQKRTATKRHTQNNQYSTAFAESSSSCRYKVSGDPQVTPKTDKESEVPNFSTIFLKSAARNIDTQEHWFFEILEKNESTANMVDLTKYLIYCAMDLNLGLSDPDNFDLTIYDFDGFTQVGSSSSDLVLEYIHFWENSGGAPTNADGTKYIVEDDGAGNLVVGYGVDIENCGYKEEFIESYEDQLFVGGEIDIDFVDSIKEMVINDKTSGVDAIIEGLELTDYQRNALISRAYNCGVGSLTDPSEPGAMGIRNGKTFVQAYEAYWEEQDDKFKETDSNADFNHELYTTYMQNPITSGGEVQSGLIKRRESEWALFQTGYYGYKTNIDKWHPSGEEIVNAAYAVADHFMNSGVTVHYAGDDVPEAKNNGRSCIYENIKGSYEKPLQNPSRYGVVCATFVSLALREAGLFADEQINKYTYNNCGGVTKMLDQAGWQKITNYNELQPGDIWFQPGHVAIYVGDGRYIDQGYCVISSKGNDNRGNLQKAKEGKFSYAYRYTL